MALLLAMLVADDDDDDDNGGVSVTAWSNLTLLWLMSRYILVCGIPVYFSGI